MDLYYQTHSPYARKVLVLIHELGLIEDTNVCHYETSPTEINRLVFAKNPLGKVPVLTDKNLALFDSAIICRHLVERNESRRSHVQATDNSYQMEALATGMADAGILARWELHRRPIEKRYPPFLDGQLTKLSESYDFLENRAYSANGENVDLGEIALACTLAWVEFVDLLSFKPGRPKLSAWYEAFCKRPSMVASPYSGTTTDVHKAKDASPSDNHTSRKPTSKRNSPSQAKPMHTPEC